MSTGSNAEWIVPTRDARSLPVVEILTGRGFVSGKSGSGKSNTTGVICEELLDSGYNFLVVDTEGEYYGLQEEYQLLHVGGDEFADVRVGPEHAETLAEIGLERNVPIILDVSGFDDVEASRELIARVVEELFRLEKQARKPFLLIVEEMQEYLPQRGGSDELAEVLERVSKRGRKRGLGLCGISQRPSSVDKDFITQCDWMVWHRLTWEADVKVVSRIIGSERKEALTELDPGEAFLLTDWDDTIERVQFRRKRTHDAGATPGLESYDRPDLKSVGSELIEELDGEVDGFDAVPPGGSPQSGAAGAQADPTSELDGSGTGGSDPAPSPDDPAPEPPAALEELSLPGDDGDDPPGQPLDEPGDGGVDSLDDLDDEAASAELERLRRRNSVLEREVEELRTLLQSVDPEHEAAADHARQPDFAGPEDAGGGDPLERPDGPTAGDAGPGAGGADRGDGEHGRPVPGPERESVPEHGPPAADGAPHAARDAADGGEAVRPSGDPAAPGPNRPTPPQPPVDRAGIPGALLEFGEMVIYFLASLWYRVRMAAFRLRGGTP